MSDDYRAVEIDYLDAHGHVWTTQIVPHLIRFEAEWLLEARDLIVGRDAVFAVKDITAWRPVK